MVMDISPTFLLRTVISHVSALFVPILVQMSIIRDTTIVRTTAGTVDVGGLSAKLFPPGSIFA